MSIEHDDDMLLASIAAGGPAPEGDDLAILLSAWRADIVAHPLPALRPAVEEDRDRAPIPLPLPLPNQRPHLHHTSGSSSVDGAASVRKPRPRPLRGPAGGLAPDTTSPKPRRRRISRPAVVAVAAALLTFGGLTVASATAQPGTPFWPITRVIFGDTAKTRVATQDAENLLDQARAAIAAGDAAKANQLIEAARVQIGQITDPEVRQRLTDEANALLTQAKQLPAQVGGVQTTPSPGQKPQAGGGGPTPSSSTGGGILPPLPTITLPSLLPSGLLPLPLPHLPLLG